MPTDPRVDVQIDADTQQLGQDLAQITLTVWALDADQYDEWHRDAAQMFLLRNDPSAVDPTYALAALAHWAEHGDRYDSPHRKAADAFWTWYRP